MPDNFSLNATIAKARAFYGKRLKKQDYDELLHKSSVSEIAEYLKRNTHFSEELEAIDTNSVHRGFLESILKRYNFNQYARLCKFQGLNKYPFYNYMIISMEIQMVISAIMHINADSSEDFIVSVPSYLISNASFDLLELSKARKYDDVLKVIRKTPYYDEIKDETPDPDGLYDCTQIEHKLRCYYLTWLRNVILKDFSPKVSKEIISIIDIQYDLINIINGFRIKAFSGSSAEEIEKLMLPVYGKLSKAKAHYLFEAKDSSDYIERLKHTFYGQQIMHFDDNMTQSNMETDVHRLRTKYAKIHLRASGSVPVSLYSILFLFDVEIQNITIIIEGIRYKAPVSYIEKLLII